MQRLRREAVLRRTGLVILSLALAVQTLGVISPPQPSLASSSSDLITGGFSTQDEAVNHCNQNTRNYKEILANYGITCENIAQATTVNVSPNDYSRGLYIMGRLSYGVTGETPVSIPDVGTLYLRHFWSLMRASSYKALKGTDVNGNTFYILYLCGNPVFIGMPVAAEYCEYDDNLYASDKACFEPCPIKDKESIAKSSDQCVEPCPYIKKITASDKKCFEPCPIQGKQDISKKSNQCFEPCKFDSTISSTSKLCKPCEEARSDDNLTVCLSHSKTARNITKSIGDANNTTAAANDVIEYTLSTTNNSKVDIKEFVITENVSDVLDYATIEDLHGGTIDSQNVISWPKQSIRASSSITAQFSIKVKDPVPNTPASSSDPAHFDMKMTNVYGNSVTINLPPTLAKTTELATTQSLPNTGPGTTLAVGFMVVAGAAFLFARNRLFAKELDLVRQGFGVTGGK